MNAIKRAVTGAVALTLLTASGIRAQNSDALPTGKSGAGVNSLDIVYTFRDQMPVGIAVTSDNRRFVSYPRWEDPLNFTLAELRDDKEVPYPESGAYQNGQKGDPQSQLVSLQGILADAQDRLWALDTGTVNMKPITPFIPKIVCFNTKTNKQELLYRVPADIAPEGSYLNDLRIDLSRGDRGTIYITDSGKNPGIIVFDIASRKSRRRLNNHPSVKPEPNFVGIVEGKPLYRRPQPGVNMNMDMGSDGIAISPDGKTLYYIALASRKLYRVSTDVLADSSKTDEQVAATVKLVDNNSVADGLGEDMLGRIYFTNWEHNAILRRSPDGLIETIITDPRIIWPDTIAIGPAGWMYFINNQLNRQGSYNEGKDMRQKPYTLFRVQLGTQPVALGSKGDGK